MQYNYNHIFLENRQISNTSAIRWSCFTAMVIGIAWIFTLFHIISVPALAFQIIAPVSIFILLLPAVVNHLMHLSDILLVGSKGINLLTGLYHVHHSYIPSRPLHNRSNIPDILQYPFW